MVDVEISERRYADLIFVRSNGLKDADVAFCIDCFCIDPEHGHWLREQAPDFDVKSELGPRRYYITFDDMTTALLYKLTWGRG